MVYVGKECRYIIFIAIMLVSIYCLKFIRIKALRISLGWKIKYLPPLTVLNFRNYTNIAKVYTSGINQNALIVKISMCEKTSKISKQRKKETNYQKNEKICLKKLELFHIFRTTVSKRKYIKCWSVKRTFMCLLLCRSYYFKHIASKIQG